MASGWPAIETRSEVLAAKADFCVRVRATCLSKLISARQTEKCTGMQAPIGDFLGLILCGQGLRALGEDHMECRLLMQHDSSNPGRRLTHGRVTGTS